MKQAPTKVGYFANLYSKQRKGIVPHTVRVTSGNFDLLSGLSFVFVCIDGGGCKATLFAWLLGQGVPFVDVGMDVRFVEESTELFGVVRVTTGTANRHHHLSSRVSYAAEAEADDAYSQNIQIADLNCLNASLAVLKWKRQLGVYQDLEREHHTTYSTNINMLTSEERVPGDGEAGQDDPANEKAA